MSVVLLADEMAELRAVRLAVATVDVMVEMLAEMKGFEKVAVMAGEKVD